MSENIHDTVSTSASVTADPFLTYKNYPEEARHALIDSTKLMAAEASEAGAE